MKGSAVLVLLSSAAGILAAPTEHQKLPVRPWFGGPIPKHRIKEFAPQAVQSPWGGSVQENQGWRTVTGETVIPEVSGQSSSAGAAAWVGIDGANCQSAILQTGVVAWGDGRVESWYEWWPEPPVYYGSDLEVKAGDHVRMSVNATSTNSGTSTLENLTTGQKITTPFEDKQDSLCLTDAEWIIEFGGGATEFADFGTWDITNTAASGDGGQATAQGGQFYNVEIDNHVYTDCSAQGDTMDCRWQ